MASRRVVVTGLGVVTSLGESHDEMWDKLCAGESGVSILRRWNTEKYPVKIGGECYDFDITSYGVDGREAKRMDRFKTQIEMQIRYTAKDVEPDLKEIIQQVANWTLDGTTGSK